MGRLLGGIALGIFFFGWGLSGAAEKTPLDDVAERIWFEARTAHFHTFSCGTTQEVARTAARLEQFAEAYAQLAGARAVASPPIVVMAFPDHASLEPFLPRYQGRAATLGGFFHRGSDENLIVLSLANGGAGSLETIFHEYTHLLLRHNERFWPLWLKEGMADIYATFEVTGERSARIGQPLPRYLRLLSSQTLIPLSQLFAVDHDSPEYNEQERQGVFYAESWLVTHYLMLGNNGARKPMFGQLTALLQQGMPADQAFTNAMRCSLPAMQQELMAYLKWGRFPWMNLAVNASLTGGKAMATRRLTPVETRFRLGDLLLRIGRLDEAEHCFAAARRIAPASPLAMEGLGLLAAERHQHQEAVQWLGDALKHGSSSFLAHYLFALEKLRLGAPSPNTYTRLEPETADQLRRELKASLALMPDFGPAQRLLGFIDIIQEGDLAEAEKHLQYAVALEPENESYVLTLAQAQLGNRHFQAARASLESLQKPYVATPIRKAAQELLRKLDGKESSSGP